MLGSKNTPTHNDRSTSITKFYNFQKLNNHAQQHPQSTQSRNGQRGQLVAYFGTMPDKASVAQSLTAQQLRGAHVARRPESRSRDVPMFQVTGYKTGENFNMRSSSVQRAAAAQNAGVVSQTALHSARSQFEHGPHSLIPSTVRSLYIKNKEA
jgi:hypothetical protein